MLPVFKSRNLPGLFDEFFSGNLLPNYIEEGAWKSTPAVNIYESIDKFDIEIAAPGLEKEDFKIDLKNDYLLVYSEKKDKKEEKEKGKVVRSEFRYSSFQVRLGLSKMYMFCVILFLRFSNLPIYFSSFFPLIENFPFSSSSRLN